MTRGIILGVIVAVVVVAYRAAPGPAASGNPKIDELFAQWNRRDTPGCTVGVSRGGQVVHERAYGMASLELGVPLTASSVLPAASISKQFTAMSVLLLARQGRLSIDDPVRKHIPELHDFGAPMTIRHLLNHTSGLRDAFTLDGWAAPQDPSVNPNDTMVRLLARQRGLNFPPGERFQYNNGGYNLLAHVVRRVSGQSLREFARASIFDPLGMRGTHFHDDPAMVVPNRASNYWMTSSGWHVGSELGGVIGNAGMQTTVGDLLRWQRNFHEPRVGDARLITEMVSPPTLASGEKSGYAIGVSVGQYRGVRVVEHGGGDRGISTYLAGYPDQNLSVAILCNSDAIPSGPLALRIADMYLTGVATQAPATDGANTTNALPAVVRLTAEQLASRAGWYADANGGLLRLSVREGTLTVRDVEGDDTLFDLTPIEPHRFLLLLGGTPMTQVDFAVEPGDREVMKVAPVGNDSMPQVFERVRWNPAVAAIEALAGEYRSEELDVTYRVEPRPGGLLIHPIGRPLIEVDAVSADMFAGSSAGTVRLLRDGSGRVTGFTFNRTVARGVRFDRVTEVSGFRRTP
ncbi:MAG TPA: serine hydrolase domain-containing protein [Vicinamibacterales bacterium]|nr:serine hydrolase domain-containing protein [Vicinamibacterales bacterium]